MEEGTPKTEMINPALLDGVSANFIIKGPTGVEKAYPMKQLAVTIGRSDHCDISVKDGSMSGKHAEIRKIEGEIRLKDLGSANGVWLNGERVDDVELFDGDVLRMGQTSVRIDVVGGRKRPDAGLSPRMLAALIAAVVLLAGGGTGAVIAWKRHVQHKRDLESLKSLVAGVRDGQRAKPCQSAVAFVGAMANTQNALGKPTCSPMPKTDDARRLVGGYRELARTYDQIVTQVQQFAARDTEALATTSAIAAQIADPAIRGRVAELEELLDARNGVASAFIADWKRLAQATNAYALQLEQAFLQNNRGACASVEKGPQAKNATEVINSCNKGFERTRGAVDEKLKEIDEIAAGGSVEAE